MAKSEKPLQKFNEQTKIRTTIINRNSVHTKIVAEMLTKIT